MQVSSVSSFCSDQESKGGHLFRLTFSAVLWGERDTAIKYRWHVWGVLTLDGPHSVFHSPRQHVLPRSTLLRLQSSLRGHCPMWVLYFVPFQDPSHSGDWVLGQHTVPGGPCILCTSLVPATQFPECATKAPSQVYRVSPLRSRSQAVTLLADVNHPGSQEDVISNWQPSHSLVETGLWGRDSSSHLPFGSVCGVPQPLCLQRQEGPKWHTTTLL